MRVNPPPPPPLSRPRYWRLARGGKSITRIAKTYSAFWKYTKNTLKIPLNITSQLHAIWWPVPGRRIIGCLVRPFRVTPWARHNHRTLGGHNQRRFFGQILTLMAGFRIRFVTPLTPSWIQFTQWKGGVNGVEEREEKGQPHHSIQRSRGTFLHPLPFYRGRIRVVFRGSCLSV